MARELKPCGTWAAYMRHRRRGEPVCEPCAAAARDQKTSRKREEQARRAEVVKLAIVETPAPEPGLVELDRLRWNLRILEATMEAGVPTGMAALSKQHAELVARIVKLEGGSKPKESKLDELARRRAERLAAASH